MLALADVRAFALTLPGVTEEPHFDRTSFRVRGRIFATALPDDPFLNVMVGDEDREPVLAAYAGWAEKLTWGDKVMGVRVDLEKADADVVRQLVCHAWARKAPRALFDAWSKDRKRKT